MKEAQRFKLLTLLLLLSLLTSGGTHQKDNRHIIGRPEIGTRSAEGNNFASTRKNRSHLALRQFLPGTSVAVLVTEAQSITIAAWSVLCNMLLQGLERCKFLEFGLTSNRLLRSICVEWEAQVQKSQVPAPRVNEKVTLCTENHELYIYVYIALWANSHQGQKGGVEWTGGISMTTRVPAVLKIHVRITYHCGGKKQSLASYWHQYLRWFQHGKNCRGQTKYLRNRVSKIYQISKIYKDKMQRMVANTIIKFSWVYPSKTYTFLEVHTLTACRAEFEFFICST